MRSSLNTLLGASVAFCIAFAPLQAVAGPSTVTQRVELGQQQTTTQQVRWQPTAGSETVTQPWTVVNSSLRVERTPTRAGRTQDQRFRTDILQQQTIKYPLEAKQVQDQTTTSNNYELRTYQILTTTSTVSVPGTQEVGAWATQSKEVQLTFTEQTPVTRIGLVPTLVPVYKTVTATYSQPVLTPLQTTRTVYQTQNVTETRYRTVPYTYTQYYNGPMTDMSNGQNFGTVTVDPSGGGLWMSCPDHLGDVYMTFVNGGHLTYSVQAYGSAQNPQQLNGDCYVFNAGDHDELLFSTDRRYYWAFGPHNYWQSQPRVRLTNHLTWQASATRQEAYTVNTTRQVPVTVPVNFSVQLEHMTNTPKDLCGTDPTRGVYWKEYHYKGTPCPYKAVQAISKIVSVYLPFYGYFYALDTNTKELDAAKAKAVTVGGAADRIAALNADDQSAFTVEYHHTDVLPQFADNAQVLSKSEQVFDHNDVQMVWGPVTTWVSHAVPVTHVVGWIPGAYQHTHTDLAVRCDDTHVARRFGNIVYHNATPVFAPVMQTVDTQVWATHSIPVTEVQTVTSTSSVLLSRVPGVETTVSTGPWMDTGETRRGTGVASSISKSVDNLLATWIEPSLDVPPAVSTANRSNTSVYMSDFRSGTSSSKQSLVGSSVRRLLNSSNAAVTQAKQTTRPRRETGRQDGKRHDDQLSGGSVSDGLISPQAQIRALIEQQELEYTGHARRERDH